MGKLKLRVALVRGPILRILYGHSFSIPRMIGVTTLLILGFYLLVKWFITQIDPLLFVGWMLLGIFFHGLYYVIRVADRINKLERRLDEHERQDHIAPKEIDL